MVFFLDKTTRYDILNYVYKFMFDGGDFMALINCPECGNEISSSAVTCPKCGFALILDDASEIAGEINTDEAQGSFSELFNNVTEILLNTQENNQMFDAMIRNQIQVKDAMINKLHDEMQYYKDDHAGRYVNQVMKSIIKIRKDMVKKITSDSFIDADADTVRKEYGYLLDDLTDLLEQQDIDPFSTDEGEPFDASKHQVFKLEPTDNPELDKCIKKSVNEGYTQKDKLLMAEKVIVYQYSKKEEEN